MSKRSIGVFDSGLGGLTVFKEMRKALPNENIVYFGDTARVPYGNKSKQTVIKFSTENILFLLKKRVKMVVVACNTASSLALTQVGRVFDIPIIGVVESGVKKALEVSANGRIGVIGTRSTISSGSYDKSLLKKNKKVKVTSCACPLFVPLVEEGTLNGPIVKEVMKKYLTKMKSKKIDTIILGCTHYPLLKKEIGSFLKGVTIVDSAQEVARYAAKILEKEDILNDGKKKGKEEFFVTDEQKSFAKHAKLFLKREIPYPKVIHV